MAIVCCSLCKKCRRTRCCCLCRLPGYYSPFSVFKLFPTTFVLFLAGYFIAGIFFEFFDSFTEKVFGCSFSEAYAGWEEEGDIGFCVSFFSLIQAIVVDKLELTVLIVLGVIIKDGILMRRVEIALFRQRCASKRCVKKRIASDVMPQNRPLIKPRKCRKPCCTVKRYPHSDRCWQKCYTTDTCYAETCRPRKKPCYCAAYDSQLRCQNSKSSSHFYATATDGETSCYEDSDGIECNCEWNKRCGYCFPSCGVGTRIPKMRGHKSNCQQYPSDSENDVFQNKQWPEDDDDDPLLVVDDAPETQRMEGEDQERNLQNGCCSLRHHRPNTRRTTAERKVRNNPPGRSGYLRPIRKRR